MVRASKNALLISIDAGGSRVVSRLVQTRASPGAPEATDATCLILPRDRRSGRIRQRGQLGLGCRGRPGVTDPDPIEDVDCRQDIAGTPTHRRGGTCVPLERSSSS